MSNWPLVQNSVVVGVAGNVAFANPAVSQPLADFTFLSPSSRYLESGKSSTLAAAAGWAFSRSTVGFGQTAAGTLTSFAINAPRVTDQGLLIEAAATNLILRSQQLDNAYWLKSAVTISADAAVAPDGTTTADKIVEDVSTGLHLIESTAETIADGVLTISQYAQQAGRSVILFLVSGGAASVYSFVNLAAGTAGAVTSEAGWSNSSISLQALAGGIWRIRLTSTKSGLATVAPKIYLTDNGNPSYAGDGVSGVNAWGAQIEAGAVASSYIATVAARVTRSADAATLTTTGSHTADVTSGGATTRPVTSSPLDLGASSGGAWVGSYITSVMVR